MSLEEIFGPPISVYTRKQALADGELVDAGKLAKEAGFKFPVALSRAAWEDFVAWDKEDNLRKGTIQDETGRLWDVLHMLMVAIKSSRANDRRVTHFKLHRVPRGGAKIRAELRELKAICGPGDEAEPVITILLPHED